MPPCVFFLKPSALAHLMTHRNESEGCIFDAALKSVRTRPENEGKEGMKQQKEGEMEDGWRCYHTFLSAYIIPICRVAFCLCVYVCVYWCHILTNPLSCYPINMLCNWNKSYQYRRLNLNYRMIDPNKDTKTFLLLVNQLRTLLLHPPECIIHFTAYQSVLNTSTGLIYMQFECSLDFLWTHEVG